MSTLLAQVGKLKQRDEIVRTWLRKHCLLIVNAYAPIETIDHGPLKVRARLLEDSVRELAQSLECIDNATNDTAVPPQRRAPLAQEAFRPMSPILEEEDEDAPM